MAHAQVWQEVGLGLSQARARYGGPRDLTEQQMTHLQVRTTVTSPLVLSPRIPFLFFFSTEPLASICSGMHRPADRTHVCDAYSMCRSVMEIAELFMMPNRAYACVQNALDTSTRVSDLFSGQQARRIQAVHPPAAVLSIAIDYDSARAELTDVVPGNDNTTVATTLECMPSDTFDAASPPPTQPRCSNLTLSGFVVGDGVLPAYSHQPAAPGWDEIVQVCCGQQCSPHTRLK